MSPVRVAAQGIARQAHTENCRKRTEEDLRSTMKPEAAHKLVKEYQDEAAERWTKRTWTTVEGQAQKKRDDELEL